MNKIGIDFDFNRFIKLDDKEIENEFIKYKENQLYSFDFLYDFFINKDIENFRDKILKKLQENNIKLTLHSSSIQSLYTTFDNEQSCNESVKLQEEVLYKIREIMCKYNMEYETTVVFHSGNYETIPKNIILDYNIKFFKDLSLKAKDIKFKILTETLSLNHPTSKNIGNCWDDIEYLCDNIMEDNWGICWDMGHTHLNYLESKQHLLPSKKVLDKVGFTHIHSAYTNHFVHQVSNIQLQHKHNFGIGHDHLPFTEGNFQTEEIKTLVKSNYQGVYSLECAFELLKKDNIPYKKVFESLAYLNRNSNHWKKLYI